MNAAPQEIRTYQQPPDVEEEAIVKIPSIEVNSRSSGEVTVLAIVSGLAPG